jgi:hypothetical protein
MEQRDRLPAMKSRIINHTKRISQGHWRHFILAMIVETAYYNQVPFSCGQTHTNDSVEDSVEGGVFRGWERCGRWCI